MEGVLLDSLGGSSAHRSRATRPPLSLSILDERVRYLQSNAIELSTWKGYSTGARDYINFCLNHCLSLNPTPETLSRYIAYSSIYIASAPKYLTGAHHFLRQLYPDFDSNRAHPFVQATITGSRKVRTDPIH